MPFLRLSDLARWAVGEYQKKLGESFSHSSTMLSADIIEGVGICSVDHRLE
jgi:hypothetical protein